MKKDIFKNISIILKPSPFDDLPNLVSNLVRWLNKRKKNIIFLESEFERFNGSIPTRDMKLIEFKDEKFVFNKSDLIISLGGDGTLIGITRMVNSKIPIFGVNLGHLGFITEFSKNDFYERLHTILSGKFIIEKKPLYQVSSTKNGLKSVEYFLNDAVFNNNHIAKMFTISVEANDDHIYNLTGDGLIISTAVGSTAYSLAAGGPIVHPNVKALILTPICPHSLTHRPLVINDDSELSLKLISNVNSATITLDGQSTVELDKDTIISIQKNNRKSISFIKNAERSYFHTLKEKFVHGRREV